MFIRPLLSRLISSHLIKSGAFHPAFRFILKLVMSVVFSDPLSSRLALRRRVARRVVFSTSVASLSDSSHVENRLPALGPAALTLVLQNPSLWWIHRCFKMRLMKSPLLINRPRSSGDSALVLVISYRSAWRRVWWSHGDDGCCWKWFLIFFFFFFFFLLTWGYWLWGRRAIESSGTEASSLSSVRPQNQWERSVVLQSRKWRTIVSQPKDETHEIFEPSFCNMTFLFSCDDGISSRT